MSDDTKPRRSLVGRATDGQTVAELSDTSGRPRLTSTAPESTTMYIVAPGHVLNDHYRLEREVARGGMGIVFEAADVKLTDRRVAIKMLPPELTGDEAAALRLQREASAVCRLDHPNCVRLLEYNVDGPIHYMVMEYLDGGTVAAHLVRAGWLPYDDVLTAARDVVSALEHAHGRGVVHRDVIPANLMYKTVDGRRYTTVTDFGIAKTLHDARMRLTGQSSAGTLLYAAPEQFAGTEPTALSDQYSLAATLYELAAGRPPFPGGAAAAAGRPAAVADLPSHASAALTRALSSDPADRFATCNDFLAAFAGASASPPVVTAKGPIVALVLAVVVLGAGWKLSRHEPTPSGPSVTVTEPVIAVPPSAPSELPGEASAVEVALQVTDDMLARRFSAARGRFSRGLQKNVPLEKLTADWPGTKLPGVALERFGKPRIEQNGDRVDVTVPFGSEKYAFDIEVGVDDRGAVQAIWFRGGQRHRFEALRLERTRSVGDALGRDALTEAWHLLGAELQGRLSIEKLQGDWPKNRTAALGAFQGVTDVYVERGEQNHPLHAILGFANGRMDVKMVYTGGPEPDGLWFRRFR